VCGCTEVAIDVDSQISNGVDRLNKSAGNWQRTVGTSSVISVTSTTNNRNLINSHNVRNVTSVSART